MTSGAGGRPRFTTIELAAVGTLTLLGLRLGLRGIGDNSMLLHLRTGIDMVASGHIPSHDPYTFTAAGRSWVVQSWLAELMYGVLHAIGGYRLVVLSQGVMTALLAFALTMLARTGRSIGTLVAAGVSVLAGALMWSPRPFMFGLLGLAFLITATERRWRPWTLIPVVWVWVNTHGSFPLGLAWLAAVYLGSWIDRRERPRWLEPYVGTFVIGLIVACVNPIGPKLLAFPLVVQRHHRVFSIIIEWRSPNFQLGYAFVSLAALCVGLLFVLRAPARWADVLPFVGFLAAGLIAVRNLPFAAVVLAPMLGRALSSVSSTDPGVAGPSPEETPGGTARAPTATSADTARAPRGPGGLPPPVVPALGIAGVALIAIAMRNPPLDLSNYPTAGEQYLATHGLLSPPHRIATSDVVGDYRELAEGAHHNVFIDDRYDMFPPSLVDDSQAIVNGQAAALPALNRWHIDVILWRKGEGPLALLRAVGGWHTVWSDSTWEIVVRNG